jgi:hypothetical protein
MSVEFGSQTFVSRSGISVDSFLEGSFDSLDRVIRKVIRIVRTTKGGNKRSGKDITKGTIDNAVKTRQVGTCSFKCNPAIDTFLESDNAFWFGWSALIDRTSYFSNNPQIRINLYIGDTSKEEKGSQVPPDRPSLALLQESWNSS